MKEKTLYIQHTDTVNLYILWDLKEDGSSGLLPDGYELTATLMDKNMNVIRTYTTADNSIHTAFPGYVINVTSQDSKRIDNIGYLSLNLTNKNNESVDQSAEIVRILGDQR